MRLPKTFVDLRFLMTRYAPGNALHRALLEAFRKVFGDLVTEYPIGMIRAAEQSGWFPSWVYEIDYRNMTRETWCRARATFDRGHHAFKARFPQARDQVEDQR